MKSKYLIGLIPSLFLLVIACLAKAAPMQGNITVDNNITYHESELVLGISDMP